jgi:hypothetical protein
MPDARCTCGLACELCKQAAHEHTGSAEAIRHSLRNGGDRLISVETGDFEGGTATVLASEARDIPWWRGSDDVRQQGFSFCS